eukprot:15346712-Ditylum_brightwellii.AAC.1
MVELFVHIVFDNPDLPGMSQTLETIPTDLLIIAMGSKKMANTLAFNLCTYNLTNKILWNKIPPLVIVPQLPTFRGRLFVVHMDFAAELNLVIASFGNSVIIYQTTVDVNIDIQHTILKQYNITVLYDGENARIYMTILNAACFNLALHFEVIPVAMVLEVNDLSCLTSESEIDWDNVTSTITFSYG